MLPVALVLAALAVTLGCASLGGYVAACKGRSPLEGAIFGGSLGPIGVLVEVLLPTIAVARAGRAEEPPGDEHVVDADLWDMHEILGMPRVEDLGPLKAGRRSRRSGRAG
jgi:hypothetical protein